MTQEDIINEIVAKGVPREYVDELIETFTRKMIERLEEQFLELFVGYDGIAVGGAIEQKPKPRRDFSKLRFDIS